MGLPLAFAPSDLAGVCRLSHPRGCGAKQQPCARARPSATPTNLPSTRGRPAPAVRRPPAGSFGRPRPGLGHGQGSVHATGGSSGGGGGGGPPRTLDSDEYEDFEEEPPVGLGDGPWGRFLLHMFRNPMFGRVVLAGFVVSTVIVVGYADFFITKDENERAWLMDRGVFAVRKRAFPRLSLLMSMSACIVTMYFGHKLGTKRVSIDGSIHGLLTLPMTFTLGFRFDSAYKRWTHARECLEGTFHHARCAAGEIVGSLGTKYPALSERMLRLLDAWLAVCAYEIGSGNNGYQHARNPRMDYSRWQEIDEVLLPEDLEG